MNCEKAQTVAADLARNEIMDANERTDALAHISECDRCRQELNDQHVLSEGLRGVADQMTALRTPAEIEVRLLAAFRAQTHVRSISRAPARWRYWVSAAAAVLLLAIGLLVWRWQAVNVRRQPAQASGKESAAPPSQITKQETLAAAGVQSPAPTLPISTPRESLPRRHRPSSQLAKGGNVKTPTAESAAAPPGDAEITEVATDFVPIGYGSAADLQYGGQLVRVELPRSVLARFGLPVNMNRADETVKADLLVGADGLARAIRFVSVTNKN
jgi:hypothetical protein